MFPHLLRPVMGPALLPIIGLIGTGVSVGSQIIGANNQADALREQGNYQKTVSDANAVMAEENATDAIKRGETDAHLLRREGDRVVGAQRAGYAGQGVDVNSGTASQVQAETRMLSAMDQLTAKNNAWREAYGYKVEAQNATKAGKFAQKAANNAADNTLLTGGLNAFSTVAGGLAQYNRDTRKAS